MNESLLLSQETRSALWTRLVERMEAYTESVGSGRVTPELDPEKIRALLAPLDFQTPMDPLAALDFAADGLAQFQTHTPHPAYFGLFNPAPATMGIAADALVAAFNPQLAAWSHSPFAIEVEQHLIRALGGRFGYDPAQTDGAFTSGGAEANHTALLTALTAAFPEFAQHGARGLAGPPALYVSAESHHSLLKAARLCGLGTDAVRLIPADDQLCMRPDLLAGQIRADRAAGRLPFFVGATAGTTNAGVIDPLRECGEIARVEKLWLHVDAAWGGAAALVPELHALLDGTEQSDSITFDAHKWLSVPMGAGIYLTRHRDILDRTFRTQTAYMPREAAGLDVIDPHLHTMQWSRRFIGLKVFLTLLVAGWDGYAAAIRHQTSMGDLLRQELARSGWRVLNQTPLPVVCFLPPEGWPETAEQVAMRIVASGKAWISTTVIGGGQRVLRACITNYRTQPTDVYALLRDLAS